MSRRFLCALALLALALVPSAQAACTLNFLSPQLYDSAANAGDIAAGDFNNDGYIDMAINHRFNDKIAILLGTPGAGLGEPTYISVGAGYVKYTDIAAGDLNEDGNLDLVVPLPWGPNGQQGHVKILIGDGQGGFAITQGPNIFQNPDEIVMADFNEDGNLDVAVIATTKLVVQLGNGFGGLGGGMEYDITPDQNISHAPVGLAYGDFDDDGFLDIAVGENVNHRVHVFYGLQGHLFTRSVETIPTPTAHEHEISAITAGDFNGDGRDDLAVANRDPYGSANRPQVAVMLSNANRTFAPYVQYGSFWFPQDIAARDMDNDGDVDLVLSAGSVDVLLNNGNGTFGQTRSSASTAAFGLAIHDLDKDGGLDVLTTRFSNSDGDAVVVLNSCAQIGLAADASPSPSTYNTPFTVAAIATAPPAVAPTGTLQLFRGATLLATTNLNTSMVVQSAVSNLEPGTYTFSAVYSGDSRFAAQTRTFSHTVLPPAFGAPQNFNAVHAGVAYSLTWIGTQEVSTYEVWRRAAGGDWSLIATTPNTSYQDAGALADGIYAYRVRGIQTGTVTPSPFSNVDIATGYPFADSTLTAGSTRVRLVHLTELRTVVNGLRSTVDLSPIAWNEGAPTIIRASQWQELRSGIEQILTVIGKPVPSWTDTMTAGLRIRAVHVTELRNAVR